MVNANSITPRKALWFGTIDYPQWISTPLTGADMSSQSWSASGTLLSGGGYAVNSWGSHKTYTFEWPKSSSREAAMMMQAYRNGTYGRGLIYFLDPMNYNLNILPARVADPSMALNNEGASLVYGLDPVSVSTSGWQTNLLPVNAAQYTLTDIAAGWRGVEDATYIPIPPGFTLYLGAFYSATGTGGIFASPQNTNGTIGSPQLLTAKSPTASEIVTDSFSGVPGVWLWLGKTASGVSTVTVQAMIARLIPTTNITGSPYVATNGEGPYSAAISTTLPMLKSGPWISGMGHSGVRFTGNPTYVVNNGVNGGQVSYSASFIEVGSWAFG